MKSIIIIILILIVVIFLGLFLLKKIQSKIIRLLFATLLVLCFSIVYYKWQKPNTSYYINHLSSVFNIEPSEISEILYVSSKRYRDDEILVVFTLKKESFEKVVRTHHTSNKPFLNTEKLQEVFDMFLIECKDYSIEEKLNLYSASLFYCDNDKLIYHYYEY